MRCLVVLIGLVLACGCAQDLHVRFPGAPPADVPASTGTLVLLLGEPASDVAVAIDGWLVVEGMHTARVVIDGIPVGTREITLAANGADKQFKVWIDLDHATTVPMGVPDATSGFLKTVAASIVSIVVYSLLH